MHDNNFTVAPAIPDTTHAFGKIFFEAFDMNVPAIYYDGELNPALAVNGKYPDEAPHLYSQQRCCYLVQQRNKVNRCYRI